MDGRASPPPLAGGNRVGFGEARDEERSVAAAESPPGAEKAPLVEGAEVAASDHRGVVEGIIRAASGGKAPAGGSCAAEAAGKLPRGTVDTDGRVTEPREGVGRCGTATVKSSGGAPERGRSGR